MSARFLSGRTYDPPRLSPPTAMHPLPWAGTWRIDLGAPVSEQTLCGLRASFGDSLPAVFAMAVDSALFKALSLSHTGLAKYLALPLAGPVDQTWPGQSVTLVIELALPDRLAGELGAATSETSAQMDM